MAQTALLQVRVDENLKETADALFAHLGMDTPTAIRIFLRQAIMRGGLPFEVCCVPNADTVSALNEAQNIKYNPDTKQYANFSELLAEIKAQM